MDASGRLVGQAWPVYTLLFCGAAAVVFLAPALQSVFIYDRSAIAGGEWWRLVTGNLVHHSTAHFILDVGSLLVAGALIEVRRHAHFATLCLAAAAGVGIVLFVADPEMRFYGGLSGVVTAAIVYLCLSGLREAGFWRWLCAVALALAMAKIGWEIAFGDGLVRFVAPPEFVPVPLSHATGAVVAFLVFVFAGRSRRPTFRKILKRREAG